MILKASTIYLKGQPVLFVAEQFFFSVNVINKFLVNQSLKMLITLRKLMA